jgi:hypothetical protein
MTIPNFGPAGMQPGSNPGQGSNGQQQGQPHPTIPFGTGNVPLFPGQPHLGQPQQVAPQQQLPFQSPSLPPNLPPVQIPQNQQQTVPSFPQGQPQPALPQYPQQQFQQQVPQAPLQIDDNAILDGANVPPELRGRRWGEIRQLYAGLTRNFTQNQGIPQPPQIPLRAAQQPQPQPQQRQTQAAPQQQAQGQPSTDFWRDPVGTLERVVDSRMERAELPQRVQQAQLAARAQIPDFDNIAPDIYAELGGVDPQILTNPQAWVFAANAVRGALVASGRYRGQGQPQAQQAPQGGPRVYSPPQGGPGQYQSAQPQQGQFFSEAPTPPAAYQVNPALTPEQMEYARAFGMDPQVYAQWRQAITISR